MADLTLNNIKDRSRRAMPGGAPGSGAGRFVLSRRTVHGLATALVVLVGTYCYVNEGSTDNVKYVGGVTAIAACLLLLVTRSILTSATVTAILVAIVVAASSIKVGLMHMAIHAYDVVYYLTSPATLSFLIDKYPIEMLKLFGAFFALGLTTYLTQRWDPIRISRGYPAIGLVCLVILTYGAAQSKDARAAWRLFEGGHALTKFYGSWPETIDTLWRGQLFETSAHSSGAPFAPENHCLLTEKPPHIILIHQESVVPPEFFPGLAYDKRTDKMFRSFDGELHKLRVETYAGASWLTEFSILAGVSTYSFGSMRPFVQALMAGKVHESLPQTLNRCGYRNTVFYPLDKNFVSNGRFYASLGMTDVFDMKAQGARLSGERDAFHYGKALDMMTEHFRTSRQPLMSYIITFATHQPYDKPFLPEVNVPGGGPGTDPAMHEFLRRLSMAHVDYRNFKADLARRFPGEKFLIVHYGDHQPASTWNLLSEAEHTAIRSGDREQTQNSAAYLTYFAVEGINYTPPPLPAFQPLDVPYLGLTVLDAARLPLSEAQKERKRLMSHCGGRYDSCASRSDILAFQRRLIDSGVLEAR